MRKKKYMRKETGVTLFSNSKFSNYVSFNYKQTYNHMHLNREIRTLYTTKQISFNSYENFTSSLLVFL